MMKTWLFIYCGGYIKRFLTVLLILVIFYSISSAGSYSVQNPSIYNPAGISTVPPSSIRSGLVNSPNTIDNSGNLIVTGNVRRGSHFRGTVPYQSTTSFTADLGSSSLSSFLRDSAGSQDYGIYSGSYRVQPYYSPEETVTTMAPGRPGVLRPVSTGIDGSADLSPSGTLGRDDSIGTDVFGLEVVPAGRSTGENSTFDLGTVPLGARYRSSTEPPSMPLSPDPSEQLLPDYPGQNRQADSDLIAQDSKRDQELSQQDRVNGTVQSPDFDRLNKTDGVFDMQVSGKQPEADTSVNNMLPVSEDNSSVTPSPDLQGRVEPSDLQQSENLPTIFVQAQVDDTELKSEESDDLMMNQSSSLSVDAQYAELQAANQKRHDALEQIRRQLEDLTRSIGDTSAKSEMREDRTTESITDMGLRLDSQPQGYGGDQRESQRSYQAISDSSKTSEPAMPDLDRSDSMSLKDLGNADVTRQEDFELTQMQDTAGSQKTDSPLEKLEELSDEELSVKARRIMGPHTSLDNFSQAKFSQHFQNGQLYMTAGRYYQAANSFNLALMYKPNDPLCLAGKGHALFAAGEYVSSALFISRALAVYPEYTQTEVNLATILGGNERIEKRIVDVEEWLARSGSDQLGFLLSYVYYRTGKLDKAKLAVDVVSQKMPQSQSVRVLKAAIDEKLTTQ